MYINSQIILNNNPEVGNNNMIKPDSQYCVWLIYSQGSDRAQWQLTRRFFLIDKVGGVKYKSKRKETDAPSIIRYVQSCTLRYAMSFVLCFNKM
jgi:hypothetical protein